MTGAPNPLEAHLDEAEQKAWESLARYKFQMFGYWAAIWVHLNRIGNFKRPNPWRDVVKLAQAHGAPAVQPAANEGEDHGEGMLCPAGL